MQVDNSGGMGQKEIATYQRAMLGRCRFNPSTIPSRYLQYLPCGSCKSVRHQPELDAKENRESGNAGQGCYGRMNFGTLRPHSSHLPRVLFYTPSCYTIHRRRLIPRSKLLAVPNFQLLPGYREPLIPLFNHQVVEDSARHWRSMETTERSINCPISLSLSSFSICTKILPVSLWLPISSSRTLEFSLNSHLRLWSMR